MRLCDFNFAFVAYFLYIIAVTIASPTQVKYESKELLKDKCEESKLLVKLNNEVTSVNIVTDSDKTLFSVDSKNTEIKEIQKLLIVTNMIVFPEKGQELPKDHSVFIVFKWPEDNGIELTLSNIMNNTLFSKKITGSNERILKPVSKCAQLSGYKVVLDPDLDANHRDGYNMTALLWTTFLGQNDIAKSLIEKGAKVNLAGCWGLVPLITAIMAGQEDMVEYLVKHGAEVNGILGENKVSPLHIAAHAGRLNCSKVLLKYGANHTSREGSLGAIPLHFATGEGHVQIVKELVGKGADVNATTKDGTTCLHIAALKGNEELVQFLIQSGADLNSKNNGSVTPLMNAVKHNFNEDVSLKMIKNMVECHNPDLNAKDKEGNTVLSLAVSKGLSRVEAYLRAHGAQ